MSKYQVVLTPEQREWLMVLATDNTNRGKRARILLHLDESPCLDRCFPEATVSRVCQVSVGTVRRLRKCFVKEGLMVALNTRRKRKIDQCVKDVVRAIYSKEPPAGHKRWSLRLIAAEMAEQGYSISYESVRQILSTG